MKKFFVLSAFSMAISQFGNAQPPTSGTIVPGVVITYDGAGNRILREPGSVCIGCKPGKNDSLIEGTPLKGSKTDVYAYPNPTTNDLFIVNRTWKEGDKASVEVFDMQSKSLFKEQVMQAKESMSFEKLAPGTYMVYYTLNGLPQAWKIIKL